MAREFKHLVGAVETGVGAASSSLAPLLTIIRDASSLKDLQPETLNVRLREPYVLRPTFTILGSEVGRDEDYRFEVCSIHDLQRLRAFLGLIMRTSTNHHGESVLEVMAEVNLRQRMSLSDGTSVEVSL
jgi:CTP-dependent riboflavin kinase